MNMAFQSYGFHIPVFLESCKSKRPLLVTNPLAGYKMFLIYSKAKKFEKPNWSLFGCLDEQNTKRQPIENTRQYNDKLQWSAIKGEGLKNKKVNIKAQAPWFLHALSWPFMILIQETKQKKRPVRTTAQEV